MTVYQQQMSGKKTLTADEILAMSSSDDDNSAASSSSSSSHSSEKKKKPQQKTTRSLETTPLANKSLTQPYPNTISPVKLSEVVEESKSSTAIKVINETKDFKVTVEQPIVVNPYTNIQTSKSANAVEQSFASRITSEAKELAKITVGITDKVTDSITDVLFKKEDAEKDHDSDPEPDTDRPSRSALRAYQAQAFKSFTAGATLAEKSAMFNQGGPDQKKPTKDEDDEPLDKEDAARILKMLEEEGSGDDESDSDEDSDNDGAKSQRSMMSSEQDLLNRSIKSEGEDVLDQINFLRYASEKVNQKFDLLEIVDKNERSFKQVAEQMIQKSSQLVTVVENENNLPVQQRRLMHQKLFNKISDRFHGDINVAQGVVYSIAAVEDFIAIGSSDGSVRLFDQSEQEIKALVDKSVKANPVTCLDIKRLDKNANLFIISGHSKGQIALYEMKGLFTQQQLQENQAKGSGFLKNSFENVFGNVNFKHQKTLDDIHKTSVVQVKFIGDFSREIVVVSCDLTGLVHLTTFSDGTFLFGATKQVLMKSRLGATYSLAPLIQIGASWRTDKVMNVTSGNSSLFRDELMKKIRPQQQQSPDGQGQALEKAQLIGFGTLDEVYVCQMKPQNVPLLSIRRPPYIQAGTVPYLDWGNALTPTFRDQAYPVLAIAWGRTIQLAVYQNEREVNSEREAPILTMDGFYFCDASIDSVFFLSESILFVMVDKKQVRILYTQNFTPGVFDDKYGSKDLRSRKVGANCDAEEEEGSKLQFIKLKEKYTGQVSVYAEKDCGYRMLDEEIRHKDYSALTGNAGNEEQKSKFNFNQTVCKNFDFDVIALGKTQIGSRNLIHWEAYLDFISKTQKDDWLKVLRTALDIFNGKMVGLAGLPDQKEKRERLLRERMKDLLRANIHACIREFQEGEAVSQKTLRVATEFCIRVGAIDYLFGDLFKMFAEGGVEQRYLENLDAFILSGKLKNVKIPPNIIERLIAYYDNKDVELLEKAILNLDMANYPKSSQVRFICEEKSLSSALIHLLTTQFKEENESDSATCLSILCALFNLMPRAKHRKTAKDVQSLTVYLQNYGTSIFELSNSDSMKLQDENKQEMFKKARGLKLEIEHSTTYIGYKVLWVIKLFLEGKKFPQGSLSQESWRFYTMDIVRFCTNERFMQEFLSFDADAFFQVLKKVFNDQEPHEYVKSQYAYIEKNKNRVTYLEACFNHTEILDVLEKKVSDVILKKQESGETEQLKEAEALNNAFLFFLTSVARNKKVPITKQLCIKIVRGQIIFHIQLLKVDKDELLELIPETQHAKKVKSSTQNIYSYLIKKNEKDVISIVARFSNELEPTEIQELLDQAQSAYLFKLKIFLYQLLGDFQKCLSLFFQLTAIKQDVFAWLNEIQHNLMQRTSESAPEPQLEEEDDSNFFDLKGVPSRISFNKMKELILQNIGDFVSMDPIQTVKLCDLWFDQEYLSIVEELKDHKELAYGFLHAVLQQNEPQILLEYSNAIMQNNLSQAISVKYKTLILRYVDVLCDRKAKNSQSQLVDCVSRNYYPIEDCLAICEKKNAVEAQAVLQRRKSQYQLSIKLYMKTIVKHCIEKLMITITLEKNIKFEDPLSTSEPMQAFDSLIQSIIKICDKYGSRLSETENQELWMYAIKGLFEVKQEVQRLKKQNEEDQSDSDSDAGQERHEEEMHFERFLIIRQQYFMSKMSEHVNLRKVIQFLETKGHAMKYDDFRNTFQAKIQTEVYHVSILNSAGKLVNKEVMTHSSELFDDYSRGVSNKDSKCSSCQTHLISKWDRQEIWVMPCEHVFHARCIAKNEGTCTLCFNELDVLNSFQQVRKEKGKGRRDSNSSQGSLNTASFSDGHRNSLSTDNSESNDGIDSIKQRKTTQIQRSLALANQGRYQKKVESRDEKVSRLMNEFDRDQKGGFLDLTSFRL